MNTETATENDTVIVPTTTDVIETQPVDNTVSTTVATDSSSPITSSIVTAQTSVTGDVATASHVSFTVTSPEIEPLVDRGK